MQLFTIAQTAFSETIRQTTYLTVLLAGFLLLALNPALSAFTLYEDDKLLLDIALSTIFLCGFVLSIFSATGTFALELEEKSILNTVSKPVNRAIFILGKFIGVGAAVLVAVYLWSLALLLTIRHGVLFAAGMPLDGPVIVLGCSALFGALLFGAAVNYLYRWNFNASFIYCLLPALSLAYPAVLAFDKHWDAQALSTDFDPQLILGLLLIAQAIAIVLSLAFAISIRLRQLVTLTICLMVFFLGIGSDYFFGSTAENSVFAQFAYSVLPNFQVLWLADALTQQHPVSAEYFLLASTYSGAYIAALLLLAIALFQTQELG